MVITKQELSYCQLEFYEHYAILTMYENSELNKKNDLEIIEHLETYYGHQDFILITHRIHKYNIDLEIYKGKRLKHMKGFAIVSKNPEEYKRALVEQELWNKSFVFFEEIKDATDWAESFF